MSVQSPIPSIESIIHLCEQEYGLRGRITGLGGENLNYKIELQDGRQYVLKLAGDELSRDAVELENHAIEHVHAAGIQVGLPRVVKTHEGKIEASFTDDHGVHRFARLLMHVPGIPWYEAGEPTLNRLRDLGHLLAEIDIALAELKHPAGRRTHPWDLSAAAQHRGKVSLISEISRRRILEWMFHFYSACALPQLPDLPHSLIHGDVNDENLLIKDGDIAGLLDFGDFLHNPTVCELAIAIAYAMLEQDDPVQVGAEIVGSYHEIRPLLVAELAVLFPLVCGRLCITVSIAAERRQIDPEHPRWFITEERAWRLLERLIDLEPIEAGNALASGTGLVPHGRDGESLEVLLERRREYLNPALSVAYSQPLKIVRGAGQFLYNDQGRPFLDLVNNVCHVGHCHPRVVQAGQRQMARLNTNTRYIYDELTAYAERLCSTLPESLDTCFFINSGSEANELALRLAMTHTERRDFLVVDGAYHGNTQRLIDMSPYKFMGEGGRGYSEPWVHVVPVPDGYRGPYKGDSRETGCAYGDEVGRVIEEVTQPIAGFITEPLLGCAGQIIPPEGYLERAFQHVRAADGLCIVDEVQVGFGRVGTHFWGFEMQGVVPDMVVMGKPIGNGHPMAAIVTTRDIAQSFANGMEFFSTFGGNPVSCAIGLAVLDVIEEEGLQEHALKIGTRIRKGLQALKAEFELIGDVRGAGLFLGVELVRNRASLEPAPEEAQELVNLMRRQGILLSTDGPYHNVVKIKPPMVLTTEDADMFIRCFSDQLQVLSPN